MKCKISDLLILIFVSMFICSCAQQTVGGKQLLTLDSRKLGSENMEIVIKETQFSDNIAQIEENVYKKGSAAGASMFGMCSFAIFAKKRGYSHYVMLEYISLPDCDGCQWSSIIEVGYLTDVKTAYVKSMRNSEESSVRNKEDIKKFLSGQFPQHDITNSEQLDIFPVNEFMLICGKLENICSW